ncbi:hypothetical protein ES705_41814 [subsurface metagenome]
MLHNGTPQKPWKIVTIKSWRHFEELVEKHSYREWVFRGQTDSSWWNCVYLPFFRKSLPKSPKYQKIAAGKRHLDVMVRASIDYKQLMKIQSCPFA